MEENLDKFDLDKFDYMIINVEHLLNGRWHNENENNLGIYTIHPLMYVKELATNKSPSYRTLLEGKWSSWKTLEFQNL